MHMKLSYMAKCIMWVCFINHCGDSKFPVLTGLAFLLAGPYSGIVFKEYKNLLCNYNHDYYVPAFSISIL